MTTPNTSLAGRVAIGTGASQGIGAATARALAAAALPIRRLGRPAEAAQAVVWLCGPGSSFVTGATLPVNGGKLAGMAPFSAPTDRDGS